VNPVRRRAIEKLRRRVLAALGGHDAELWLFGSCARDEALRHSDIDIADLRRAAASLVDEVRRESVKCALAKPG
jgi:predicted nucleotidyltransferase